MKHFYISIREVFSLVFILLTGMVSFAQVGIGTETPNQHAILDVFSNSSSPGGLLMPRVALQNTVDESPLGAHVAGMTVYNTAYTGDVTPGFYFNDGTRWVRIAADSGPQPEGWLLQGNSGTNPNNHFLGTTDNQPLRIRTNSVNRFEFTTGGHLRANGFGTAGEPTYSWVGRTNTGLWSPANNTMGFSTNGSERMRVIANGNVGINTTSPSQRLHVVGNLRLQGAFMPNNQAGNQGRVLISAGADNSPQWGADVSTVNAITRYITTNGMDIEAGGRYSITVSIPGLTAGGSAIVNIQGNWNDHIYDHITIHNIEVRTDEVRFGITNNTGGWLNPAINYPGMRFNVTIIR